MSPAKNNKLACAISILLEYSGDLLAFAGVLTNIEVADISLYASSRRMSMLVLFTILLHRVSGSENLLWMMTLEKIYQSFLLLQYSDDNQFFKNYFSASYSIIED